jgi:phytanoyl-CoA dioxygenase PhyH
MATHSASLRALSPAENLRRRLFALAARCIGWWRAPFWAIALFTGAKSFVDNPILGSTALNRRGLHVWRMKAAHALAWWRRARLAGGLPRQLRDDFDRNGFVVVRNVFPEEEFAQLQKAILETGLECRAQQQGDTITRRVPFGPELASRFPALARLVRSARWRGLMAYVASTSSQPLYYIQTISGGIAEGPPDPQLQLHSDTFHPSLKAWLFLTDVEDDGRPLTYVAGSHRLSNARIEWERRKSAEVMTAGDRLSQRGSLRIKPDELEALGLPQPTRFCVPANTLVIADTCGFHARASSHRPTIRVELWAYCRRNPFLPWTMGGPFSWGWIGERRAEFVVKLVDWLERRGMHRQHWRPAGLKRPIDP